MVCFFDSYRFLVRFDFKFWSILPKLCNFDQNSHMWWQFSDLGLKIEIWLHYMDINCTGLFIVKQKYTSPSNWQNSKVGQSTYVQQTDLITKWPSARVLICAESHYHRCLSLLTLYLIENILEVFLRKVETGKSFGTFLVNLWDQFWNALETEPLDLQICKKPVTYVTLTE